MKRGDRVGLFLPNGPAFLNAYFALGKLGATMVPINTAYRGYMLEYLLNDTACEVLVVDATLLDRVLDVGRPAGRRSRRSSSAGADGAVDDAVADGRLRVAARRADRRPTRTCVTTT